MSETGSRTDPGVPPRLTMAMFWRDFADEVFSLDRGLPWTFWQMLVRPGQFIRLYIDQRDLRITRPVRYYLIGFVAAALVFQTTAPTAEMAGMIRNGFGDQGGAAAVWMVLEHPALLALLTFVPGIACGLRIAYAVHRPTFAEMWVFAVFSIAQLLIVWAFASALIAMYSPLNFWLGIPLLALTPVYLVEVCLGYFPQPGVGRVLRAVLATALGIALVYAFSAAILIGAFQIGKHWPEVFGN